MNNNDKICVLGMGYVGLTLAATLAEAGFKVLGVDIVQEVIESLKKNKCYFLEPGLNELIEKVGGKDLEFSLTIPDKSCNYYMISVGTPIDQTTKKPQLDSVKNVTESIIPHIKRGDTIILRSTVPVGTSRNVVMRMIESGAGLKAGLDFYFGFVPERTIEGNALYEQKNIPQIIGALNEESVRKISKVFGSFNDELILVPEMEHAELCKIIDNTYRDVNFAYANQMAMISERLGLDFHVIRQACNSGYQRNNVPAPSPGVGGACLTKDPYILIDLCQKLNINTQLIKVGREINETVVPNLTEKILGRLTALGKNIYSSKIFIMGFAFKGEPETSDTRFSTTLDLVNYLKPVCSKIYGYDGVVNDEEIELAGVTACSIKDGFEGADVVVIMNTHRSHIGLGIKELSKKSNHPLIFVDCWNLYDKSEIQKDGNVIYSSIGLY